MRTLILMVVTLHLVIVVPKPVEQPPYQYGDIIAFPKTGYKHYAIYLDKNRFPEQKDEENLFHFTGPIPQKGLSGCIFGKIEPNQKHEVDNYLDKIQEFKNKASEKEITARIKEKYESCKKKDEKWNPLTNNCEHLATYVRYGVKISLQCGEAAAILVENPHISKELLNEIKGDLENTQKNLCNQSCKLNQKA